MCGAGCNRLVQFPLTASVGGNTAEWVEFDWTSRTASATGVDLLRLNLQSTKDIAFLLALIACLLCMGTATSACMRLLCRWGWRGGSSISWVLWGDGSKSPGGRDRSSPRQFTRQSSLPVAFQWNAKQAALQAKEVENRFLSIIVPDVLNPVEIQSAASRLLTVSQSSMSLCAEPSGGDALSPLPVPVAFRQPREMRHRRVNSWGTPTDNTMQRSGSASSFNTVIDIEALQER
jgi:hypothetical protein